MSDQSDGDSNNKLIKKTAYTAIAAYITIFLVSALILDLNEWARGSMLSILYIIPIFVAFSSCIWAYKNSETYKRLWRLMAIGLGFWLTGAIVLAGYTLNLGPNNIPYPSIADYFILAYLPITLGVMISLGRIRPPFDMRKKQFVVSVTTAALAAFLLTFEFIIVPSWHSHPNMGIMERSFAIAYPVFDWIVFVSLLFASRRLRSEKVEGWVLLLMTGFALSIFADIAFYLSGNMMNPITTLGLIMTLILIAIAAIDEVTGAFVGIINGKQPELNASSELRASIRDPWNTLVIPLMTITVIPIVWLASMHGRTELETPVLVSVSSAIIALSVYRNYLLVSENAVLFAKTLRDGLTGLNNHRYFQEVLRRDIGKAEKTRNNVSMLVIDVDDFARVNKIYGHLYGDKVLIAIGRAIIRTVREADEVCRLNGDEFGVILPDTDSTSGLLIAKKIRKNISELLARTFQKMDIWVTIGISTYPTLADDQDELLSTAYGALYWGKMHGKNTILLYDSEIVNTLSADERAEKAEEAALIDMVRSLAKAVDARDSYTRLHSKRVSSLARKLAEHMGLDDVIVNRIEVAGILHDVGKIGIPDNILNKRDRLTVDEMEILKSHPALSSQIIKSTSLKEIVPSVRGHHERWDGDGYPDGLKGEAIPLEARILAIADAFDAMTKDRPYRKAFPLDYALNEIRRCAGKQFDPVIVSQFLSMFPIDDDNCTSVVILEEQINTQYDLTQYDLAI